MISERLEISKSTPYRKSLTVSSPMWKAIAKPLKAPKSLVP